MQHGQQQHGSNTYRQQHNRNRNGNGNRQHHGERNYRGKGDHSNFNNNSRGMKRRTDQSVGNQYERESKRAKWWRQNLKMNN